MFHQHTPAHRSYLPNCSRRCRRCIGQNRAHTSDSSHGISHTASERRQRSSPWHTRSHRSCGRHGGRALCGRTGTDWTPGPRRFHSL
uniref:Uncharacterized protein n=1 Tax=Anguilla anguilla TaxID=7936 RepID=A0A0E9XJC5_ANGAN